MAALPSILHGPALEQRGKDLKGGKEAPLNILGDAQWDWGMDIPGITTPALWVGESVVFPTSRGRPLVGAANQGIRRPPLTLELLGDSRHRVFSVSIQ